MGAVAESGDLQGMLKLYPAEDMAAWPVSRKVNSLRNDSEECMEAVS